MACRCHRRRRLLLLLLLLSLPNLHGHALSPCSSDKERQALATLEAHTTDDAHGDVCRMQDGDFFCVEPCFKFQKAPWCVGGADMSPCRIGGRSGENSGSVEDRPAIKMKNLPLSTSQGFLRELFAPIGPVKHVIIHKGGSSSAAEVIFEEQAHAVEAVKRFDGVKLFGGNPITVEKSVGGDGPPEGAKLDATQRREGTIERPRASPAVTIDIFIRTYRRDVSGLLPYALKSIERFGSVHGPANDANRIIQSVILCFPTSDFPIFDDFAGKAEAFPGLTVKLVKTDTSERKLPIFWDYVHADTMSSAELIVHMDGDMLYMDQVRLIDLVNLNTKAPYLIVAPFSQFEPEVCCRNCAPLAQNVMTHKLTCRGRLLSGEERK